MNRLHILSLFVVCSCGGVLIAGSAVSQSGQPKNLVQLQASTPGISQSGHTNISGTSRAGQFVGGGAGLADVNADSLDGFDSSAFLQGIPDPLVLTSNTDGIIEVINTDPSGRSAIRATGGPAIFATNSVPNVDVATLVANDDTTGLHVIGTNGHSVSASTLNGRGVYGRAEGTGYGVFGSSQSGFGVRAEASGPNGTALFVQGMNGAAGLLADGVSRFYSNVELRDFAKLSIGFTENPVFPVDFAESLGDKISLWGTNPSAHYGFGVQGGLLQIFSDTDASAVGIGYGGSQNFDEVVRFTSNSMRCHMGDFGTPFTVDTPNDFTVDRDRNNFWTSAMFRVFTNSKTIEQLRIRDDDEASSLFDGAVVANGIDFAEGFRVFDTTLEPGELVVNSHSNWEYVTRSSEAYQSAVIGVVSTKPAFVAGMSFNAEDQMDPELTRMRDEARRKGDQEREKELTLQMEELVKQYYRPIAFVGRVPVKVVGTVKPGDKLTASNVPGKAMAMTQNGHSIGIALQGNPGGSGTVMAMIQPGFVTLEKSALTLAEFATQNAAKDAEIVKLNKRVEELESRIDRLEKLLEQRLK